MPFFRYLWKSKVFRYVFFINLGLNFYPFIEKEIAQLKSIPVITYQDCIDVTQLRLSPQKKQVGYFSQSLSLLTHQFDVDVALIPYDENQIFVLEEILRQIKTDAILDLIVASSQIRGPPQA